MKIRRLEIQGFKSFADRTVLRFGDGITGIVGPNGCGKSNIVDAIRWVMGEQSAKHLRGAGMQDVIFAGSEIRGPLGMAEVTITFRNDGGLGMPEYDKFDEISVTRRLYRDGSSEYAINRVPSRLRDILELFMGTGIGKNAYSIIEQGRIGLIVTAKPEDRRAFIEDAAGVSRYKARRKQAERRIEATEQNLLRVTDLTQGLAERLKSLENQAEKAKKYLALKDELRELDLHAGAHRYLELSIVERQLTTALREIQSKVQGEESAIAADEARLREAEDALEVEREELRGAEHHYLEEQKALALAENDAGAFRREISRLEERRVEGETELVTLRSERETLRSEAFASEQSAESLFAGEATEDQSLADRGEALTERQTRLETARETLEAQKQALFEVLTAINEGRARAATNAQRRTELEGRLDKLGSVRRATSERARKTESQAKQIEAELAKGRQLELDLKSQQSAQKALQARLKEETGALESQLAESREALSDKRAHLNSLLEIQRNYEGCTDAVRSLMLEKDKDPQLDKALHGLVADVVSAEPRYEAAVEAVLGDRLQYVIVNSQQDGVASVEYLRAHGQGRSTFVPLDLREDHVSWAPRKRVYRSSHPPVSSGSAPPELTQGPKPASDVGPAEPAPHGEAPLPGPGFHAPLESETPAVSMVPSPADAELPVPEVADSFVWVEADDDGWPDLTATAVCGKMTDLVRAQPGYEHVARVLLGDVVVVEDLEEARRIWTHNGHRKTLVTLSGDVLDPVGLLTGGASEGRHAGILTQKRRIKELEEEVRTLSGKVELARERHAQVSQKLESVSQELQRTDRARHEGEVHVVNLERDLARLQAELARERKEQGAVLEEIEELESVQASLVADASSEDPEALERRRAEAEAGVQAASASVTSLSEEVRSIQDELTELKVEVAANREKREGARRQLERIQKRLTEIDNREERLLEALESQARELSDLRSKVNDSDGRATSLRAGLEEQEGRLERARASLAEREKRLREDSEDTRAKRAEIDGFKTRAGELSVKLREAEIGQENLVAQIEDRYHLDVKSLLVEYHAQAPLGDVEQKRIKKLRKQIDGMGPINLSAIEECEEVRERHDYLEEQKTDLEGAVRSLKDAIRKINKTSRERYVEAFRLVNEKFQQIFPRLFNGGRCALVMTDESEPLESGIEIMAQPPGKKLQSVNLLSGGEKALTAVSLIFGIFLIKPTPFCLLDEVDAPLDETNVGRYNDMLREMSAISQFILITHNKRTMELPDRLYGVTMEDPGVSKLVPVDVSEGNRIVSNG
ncbi:MAG: chromosome segregation protein SMC [Myxococcota bacterium]